MSKNRIRIKRQLNDMLKGRDVVAEYKKYKAYDVPDIRIFRNHIEPKFHISYSIFYRYISTPIEKNIKQLQRELADYDSKNNHRK